MRVPSDPMGTLTTQHAQTTARPRTRSRARSASSREAGPRRDGARSTQPSAKWARIAVAREAPNRSPGGQDPTTGREAAVPAKRRTAHQVAGPHYRPRSGSAREAPNRPPGGRTPLLAAKRQCSRSAEPPARWQDPTTGREAAAPAKRPRAAADAMRPVPCKVGPHRSGARSAEPPARWQDPTTGREAAVPAKQATGHGQARSAQRQRGRPRAAARREAPTAREAGNQWSGQPAEPGAHPKVGREAPKHPRKRRAANAAGRLPDGRARVPKLP
jgi:hypothetical protein